jgi:Family of unknown function (DUF6535)
VTSSKTGLFSAIVGAFIIEFYKKLSPDSGDQTVALLQQISHQLPNSPNGTNSNTANQPSSPGTAMVWVNALWLISLVLSLTCALIATLLQQWARRYTETPKFTNVLRHRVRIRSLLLDGMKMYKILLIVEILPTLLHLSVFLFLGGLVITFHTIYKTVAIAVDVAVGVSGLAYISLSVLPCLDVKCPYRTPISKILWYPCHALLSLAALCLHKCILGLRRLLNQPVPSRGQGVLSRWLHSRGFSVSNHWRFLTDGLEKSIVDRAVKTLGDEDRKRVTWLFNRLALGDKDKFLKFAAIIPRHKIPDFIPTIKSDSFRDFLESLFVLLRGCVASGYPARPYDDSDTHKRPLLVCLHAIRHIVKANPPTFPDLNFLLDHFTNTGLMWPLWSDMNNSIRITSRSICALVARRLVRKQRFEVAALSWLQEVTGELSDSILNADVTVRNQMNFKSFVIGALQGYSPYSGSDLSTEDTRSFNETLAILLDVKPDGPDYFTTPIWETRLSKEAERIGRYDPEGASEVFGALRLVFPYLPTPAHWIEAPPSDLISPTEIAEYPEVSPPGTVFPPGADFPLGADFPSGAYFPPDALLPPRAVLPGASPSPPAPPRAPSPPRPLTVNHHRALRPSNRAHRNHAPM